MAPFPRWLRVLPIRVTAFSMRSSGVSPSPSRMSPCSRELRTTRTRWTVSPYRTFSTAAEWREQLSTLLFAKVLPMSTHELAGTDALSAFLAASPAARFEAEEMKQKLPQTGQTAS